MGTFWDHLVSRGYDAYSCAGVWADSLSEAVTFYLYSLDHRLVGIQLYKYKEPKKTKYHTVSSEQGIWGLECLSDKPDTIYVVEGVWDAIALKSLGYDAVAVLCNSPPKALCTALKSLAPRVVAVCDGDVAGKKLATHFNEAIYLADGEDASSLLANGNLAQSLNME